jgi:hypothetical protein
MFGRTQKAGRQKQINRARLHSIAGILQGRNFVGGFNLAGANYKFTYAPSKAAVIGRRLQLVGRLSVTDSRGQTRTKENVRATLLATQGGLGAAPVRQQILVGGVAASTASTSNQQQQQAGGVAGVEPGKRDDAAKTRPLPEVDFTGPLSFTGAMYFMLDALDAAAIGIPADLSRVQLNARLAPADDSGRALQGIYSTIADALYTKQVNQPLAAAAVVELNKLLAASR